MRNMMHLTTLEYLNVFQLASKCIHEPVNKQNNGIPFNNAPLFPEGKVLHIVAVQSQFVIKHHYKESL